MERYYYDDAHDAYYYDIRRELFEWPDLADLEELHGPFDGDPFEGYLDH